MSSYDGSEAAIIPRVLRDEVSGRPATDASEPGAWRFDTTDPLLEPVVDTLRTLLAAHLPPHGSSQPRRVPGEVEIELRRGEVPWTARPVGVAPDGSPDPDESYALRVTGDRITCRARGAAGAFRGGVTAAMLVATRHRTGRDGPVSEGTVGEGPVGEGMVLDAPRYAWRGLMVDAARGFPEPAELRRIIELCALYKLNVLHLHLSDDEAWRLAVPGHPELTRGAAHYTVAQYRQLQEYAARHFVTIVPEIDLPGHCTALLNARGDLARTPPTTRSGGAAAAHPAVPPAIDLRDAATARVIDDILARVCAATRGPFVHIGGDETFGISDDGFRHAVRRLRSAIRAAGKRPLSWQESARAGMTGDDIGQFWVDVPMMDLPGSQAELDARPELREAGLTMPFIRGLTRFFAPTDGDLARIVAGGRVLLSPQSHLYLDRPYDLDGVPDGQVSQARRLGFPSYRRRGVRHAASWDPAAHGVPDDRVAGVEATLFGACGDHFSDLMMLLLPRLAGFAETAWAGSPAPWSQYRLRLAQHAPLWRRRGLPYLASTEVPWAS